MKLDQYLGPEVAIEDILPSRYDLGPEELSVLEREICEDAREHFGDGLSIAWITPNHPFSNFVRTHEASQFPEATDVDPQYDKAQVYLAIVDTRDGKNSIVHAASLMKARIYDAEPSPEAKTGIYTVDSLIELGNFTAEEFLDFYRKKEVSIERSIAVETNFKIESDFKPFSGLGSADLTYLTLFNTLLDNQAPVGNTVVFATINTLQIKSLRRSGVDIEPLMGRYDFQTEEAEKGVYSMPATILVNQNTYDIFSRLNLKLPELVY